MANTRISGLVSGLDTATIISQLMQIEAQPQTNLKNRVSGEQKVVSALQSLNSKLAGIGTKAADLAKLSNWSPMKTTSSNDKVTVTTSTGAIPATLDLTVRRLATSHTIDFGLHALTDKVTSDGSTTVLLDKLDGSDPIQLDTKDGTVQGLVNAINAKDNGVRATLVQMSPGSYCLHVTATTTGPSSDFKLTDSGGKDQDAPGTALALVGTATAGVKAQITVGPDPIESESNTFKELMPGVDVTLNPGATGPATISVQTDPSSLSDKVKAMIDAVNSVLDDISSQTAYDSTTKTAGLLAGDSTVRSIKDQLVESVSGGINGKSLAPYGVQTDRYGKLVFDAAKFQAAYAADPVTTSQMFAAPSDPNAAGAVTGLAAKLQSLSKTFSDSLDGTVTQHIQSRQASIKGWQDDIADWDTRLAARQATLQAQYTAMETALGKLQSQASWLNGQIATLPTMSSQ